MDEKLLAELEQTATACSVREALISAYQAGAADALHTTFLSITKPQEYTIMEKVQDEAVNE